MKNNSGSIPAITLCLFLLSTSSFIPENVMAQRARVFEQQKLLKTYPYSDPDPVPILTENPKIYPYFTFEGYSAEGKEMPWKVITLENDYIQVFVLPESGGKVWGAIEKSTGNEFIYRNEVMKFRNIAMRGPWTSGGIEFNFGIIGHSPSTASRVDYLTTENEDGSVSCWIGNLDLPSRTKWRIEIRLPADKAYFETHTQWFNPTSLTQSYYNWMTAAAPAREDLEFFWPGYLYLEHSGEAHSWPIDDQDRNLALYKNNNFGPSKSYHVVGTYEDFFGGYFHNPEVGFGHWSPYEEMPGQKLWLWALSRSGGIWEDLLTDTDGQYIEFQAGRLFNQYSPGRESNPIRQVGFAPCATDRWDEVWFPFKNIRGMTDASPFGVLNIERNKDNLSLGINALGSLNDSLVVRLNGKKIFSTQLKMAPMEIYSVDLEDVSGGDLEVEVGDHLLYYTSRQDSIRLKRPFKQDPQIKLSETERLYQEALDAMNFREYEKAENVLHQLLEKEAFHIDGLLLMSELNIRNADYEKALLNTRQVLKINTYEDRANYLAGLAFRATDDLVNALESMGWAARSMEFRSVAYAQMAEMYVNLKRYDLVIKYAKEALDFNAYNERALQVRAIAERKSNQMQEAGKVVRKMLEMDPLNHVARFEKTMLEASASQDAAFTEGIRNEFPEETCLEIALYYTSMNLWEEAVRVLSLGPETVKNNLWLAYLLHPSQPEKSQEIFEQAVNASPDFVFPYRPESRNMLKWANEQLDSWKMKYYLALNQAALNHPEEAARLLTSCGNEPDSWVFYITRTDLSEGSNQDQLEQDLKKAWELATESWRSWDRLIRYYENENQFDQALTLAKKAYDKFPENYSLGFQYAKALLNTGKYAASIDVLKNIHILPFEGSYESRMVYENAHLQLALEYIENKKYKRAIETLNKSLEWPENIGVGKPYDPDERKEEFLMALCYRAINKTSDAEKFLRHIIDYTLNNASDLSPEHILGLASMDILGHNQEATDFVGKIQENSDNNDPVRKWILSTYDQMKNGILNLTAGTSGDDRFTKLAQILLLFNPY
jgi:lipopolysaccharide biosynthesis regulator YciM